jgi:ubiquinone/menaquinone biosynthesis C-methylase UbiE
LPWDVGVVQPAVVELAERDRFRGHVLDVGCGLGNNSVYLAGRGLRVTGLDSAKSAVEQARARAGDVEVEFAVADAAELGGYEGQFDSVLDSMVFHAVDPAVRSRYTAALYRVTKPGALLSTLTFTDALGGPLTGLGIPEADLRSTYGDAGWEITDLDRTTFVVVASTMLDALRAAGVDAEVDDAGFIRVPVWRSLATRT